MYPRIARESHADSTTEGGFRWRGRLTTGASDTYGGYRASGIRGRISDLTWSGTPGWRRSSPRGDAEAWLAAEHRLISMGEWTDPIARRRAEDPMTFGPFAETWLDQQILSTFGHLSLADVTPATVRMWFGSYGSKTPAYRARAYQVLRAIFETAVSDELIVANPAGSRAVARTRGSGRSRPPRWTRSRRSPRPCLPDSLWRFLWHRSVHCGLER